MGWGSCLAGGEGGSGCRRFARLLEARVAGRCGPAPELAAPGPVTDSGTVVRLESTAALNVLEELALPSDLWTEDRVAYLLFHGVGQADATDWLERAGVHRIAEVRGAHA